MFIERRYNCSALEYPASKPKRIGDLILTMPAVAALREKLPDARITLVGSARCADLFPAMPNIDRILITQRNPGDIARHLLPWRVRFDYCIDFTRNDRPSLSCLFIPRAETGRVPPCPRSIKNRARIYNQFVDNRMRTHATVDYNLAFWRSHRAPQRFPRGSSGVAGASP